MSREIWERLVKGVEKKARALDSLHIGWFGGEPLLAYEAVAYLSENFIRLAREYKYNYSAEMTTNGYLLNSEMFRNLLDYHVKFFQVSFDGSPKYHNQRRVHENGTGTFDTIIQNLREMKNINDDFKVSLRIHFDKENLHEIPVLLDILSFHLAGDNRFRVYFRPYFNTQEIKAKDCGINPYIKENTAEIMFDLLQESLEKGLNIFFFQLQPKFYYCAAELNYHFLLNPDGKMLGCTYSMDEDASPGELTEEGEFKIAYDKRIPWLAQDPLEDKVCRKCKYLPLCGGGCVYQRIKNNKRTCFHEKSILRKILDFAFKNSDKFNQIQS